MEKKTAIPPLPPVLRAMVEEGRLVHSINLEGEPGSGRTALAMALAGAILCERQGGEMCGECLQCRKVLAGAHSDVILVDKGNLPTKEQVKYIRELRSGVYQSPREGRAKVYIFADVFSGSPALSRDSQNILLKVIEEPPENTFFLFTCDNKYRMLPTILSRVVTVPLRPLTVAECQEVLARRVPGKTGEEYREAALLGCGSPGTGERLLTQAKAAGQARAARALVEALAARDPYRAMAAAIPFEKERQDYAALLDTAARLCALPELRQELGLSPAGAAAVRGQLEKAAERNRQNGYLPLLTATLAAGAARLRIR